MSSHGDVIAAFTVATIVTIAVVFGILMAVQGTPPDHVTGTPRFEAVSDVPAQPEGRTT